MKYNHVAAPIQINEQLEVAQFSKLDLDESYFENYIFEEETILEDSCGIQYNSCLFKKCNFSGSQFVRTQFVDCIFQNCDLSNVSFESCGIHRTHFINSKITGLQLIESKMANCIMNEAYGRYINFSNDSFTHSEFIHCGMIESSFMNLKLEKVIFDTCDLSRLELFETKLKNIDLSSCTLDGLHASIDNVKGATMNQFQALMIAEMVGIKVKE